MRVLVLLDLDHSDVVGFVLGSLLQLCSSFCHFLQFLFSPLEMAANLGLKVIQLAAQS